jgi:hypothetical protein
MSPRGLQLANAIARTFELIKEHDKLASAEVDELYGLIVSHVRSARPHVLLAAGAP